MSIHPEIMRKFKTNPLGTTVAIILTFLLLYFLQSSVGPFGSNASIRQNMVNFWNNSNWILKVIWPLWGALMALGFLLDDARTERLRPIIIGIGRRTGGRLLRRAGETAPGRFATFAAKRGERIIRREEEELEQFESEETG